MRFGYAPAAPTGVATLGANTFTGTQMAPAFVGNGSGLTNVSANLLDGLDSTAFALAAHGHNVSQVTNAARVSGGNTFTGLQTIDLGNLDLDPSTAATGNLLKNGSPFLHNFGTNNTFLGVNSGNFTLSGDLNTATGFNALFKNTTGIANTGKGSYALFNNTTGGTNTASGYLALFNNTTGNNNVGLGYNAGANATTGSNNIYLGAGVFGEVGESNAIYLGLPGFHTKTVVAGIRGTAGVGRGDGDGGRERAARQRPRYPRDE